MNEQADSIHRRCMEHATELVSAAQMLAGAQHYNLAFHLALVAIEETGKAALLVLDDPAWRAVEREPRSEVELEDHVEKVFWALWLTFGAFPGQFADPSKTGREIAKALEREVGSNRELAEVLHKMRLRALYVDPSASAIAPSAVVTKATAEWLIQGAQLCLEKTRSIKPVQLDGEQREDFKWWLNKAQSKEMRPLVWTRETLAKYAELDNTAAWIRWLRERVRSIEAEGMALIKAELARERAGDTKSARPKWEVRFLLHSASHTYSRRAARVWNERNPWTKLVKVDNHPRTIAVEVTLPDAVHMTHLWPAAWECSRGVAAALSMGALGFVWFEQPQFTSKFYERIRDVEAKAEVGVERNPRLAVKWHEGPFEEGMMLHALMCFLLFMNSRDTPLRGAFERYVQGLALMGKSDLFLRVEGNAFLEFFDALMMGLKAAGKWDGQGEGREVFESYTGGVLRDEDDRVAYFDAAQSLRRHDNPVLAITLEQVGVMKVVCDMLFIEEAKARLANREFEEPPGSAG